MCVCVCACVRVCVRTGEREICYHRGRRGEERRGGEGRGQCMCVHVRVCVCVSLNQLNVSISPGHSLMQVPTLLHLMEPIGLNRNVMSENVCPIKLL